MALPELVLTPDNSSYSVTDGKEVVATQLDGGAARYRRDILGATSSVQVVWITDRDGYKYLRSFYRAVTQSGATPFMIGLVLDEPTVTDHKAYFVPGSMSLQSQKGLSYTVAASLEVYPSEIGEHDADFVYMINGFGWNWRQYGDKLNIIVNELWPEVL